MFKTVKRLMPLLLCTALFPAVAHGWLVEIDCERGAVGERAVGESGLGHADPGTVYSDEIAYSGKQSCKLQIDEGDFRWGGSKDLPNHLKKGDEVWVRIATYFPAGFDYNSYSAGNRLKFLRLHTRSDRPEDYCVGENEGYMDWYIYPTYRNSGDEAYGVIKECDRGAAWSSFGSLAGKGIEHDKWQVYEMYVKFDDVSSMDGGMALVRVWRNDELLGEFTKHTTLETPDSYARSFLLFSYWNGGSPKTQHMFIDDLVITNEMPSTRDASGNPRIGIVGLGNLPSAPSAVEVN